MALAHVLFGTASYYQEEAIGYGRNLIFKPDVAMIKRQDADTNIDESAYAEKK